MTKQLNLDRALSIKGWMNKGELAWLAEQASRSEYVLEIGSYKGRSARALGDNTSGRVYCIDPWERIYYATDNTIHGINPAVFPEFCNNLRDLIDSGKVIPLTGRVGDYTDFFNIQFDLAFIDGDHRYNEILKDIEFCKKHVKKGGIIAGHDYIHWDWPDVKRAVDDTYGDKINVTESIWWVIND